MSAEHPAAKPSRTDRMIASRHARIRWLGWLFKIRRYVAFDWSRGPWPTERTGERAYTVLLGLTTGVFFWAAADSGDWLVGVAADTFLVAFIVNLSRYAR